MKISALFVGCALSLAGFQAHAVPVLSDNFNSEHGGVAIAGYNSFANWNVTPTVDLIGNGFFDVYPGHGLYVDLDGSTNQSGGLTSKIFFAPGNYFLSFALGGSQRGDTNTVDVNLGSYSETFTLASADPLTTYVRSVTVFAPGQLSFLQTNPGDNRGLKLDDILVDSIPEPSSLGMLAAGLLACRLLRRRKTNRA